MAKRRSNKGFMLSEMCIVIISLSLLCAICIPAHEFSEQAWYLFPSGYLVKQSEAIKTASYVEYDPEEGPSVIFNETGNVQQAKTVDLSEKERKIIIELGGGRLVQKE